MPEKHSFFNASASARRLQCPASAVVDTSQFPKRPKRAADHGTMLHGVAEKALKTGKEVKEIRKLCRVDHLSVCAYVDYIRSLKGWEKFYEFPAHLTPLLGGTADFVGVSPDVFQLKVVDYKSGSFAVEAEDNQQLLVYGAAVLLKLGAEYEEIEDISLEIVQPAVDSRPLKWEVPRHLVERVGERHVKLVEDIMDGLADFNPSEEACRWCDARSKCPAYGQAALDAARREFMEHRDEYDDEVDEILTLEVDELSWTDKLRIAPLAANWARMIQDEAKEALLDAPDSIPGKKVVEGRRVRDWKGEAGRRGAEFYLKTLFGFEDSDLYGEAPFVSPHKAEKLFSGKGSTAHRRGLEDYTYRKHGPPTLADEDDERSVLTRSDMLRWDFEGVEDDRD